MKPIFGLFLFFVFSFTANAQKIDYEIFGIEKDGKTTTLATGIKEYGDSDFQITEMTSSNGERHWKKLLMLKDGFAIGVSIYREPEITGFGLWAKRSDCGFSWEWFNLSGPDTYIKLQESGEISASYRTIQAMREISEIRFDTDVSLRLNESNNIKRETHRILIKKGSILRFPANNPKTAAIQTHSCNRM
jgi:hypothetical protein